MDDDEDEDEKPPVPKRTTSRTASAQQILQAIKQQQKTTTLTSITSTSTTLPSGITASTANIEMKRLIDPQLSQSKQIVGICQTNGLGILSTSGQPSTSLPMPGQRGHHAGPATEFPRGALSESALQWSSESTLEASELVRRKHAKHQHAIHHHHYFYHHHPQKQGGARPDLPEKRVGYRNGHQRSLSGGSAGHGSRPFDMQDETYGQRRVAIQNGFSSKKTMMSKDDMMLHQRKSPAQFQQDALSDTEETAGEVCLECSEWLGRALLCSCQVPSSSSANSSPSQSANAATASGGNVTLPEGHPVRTSSDSIEHRSSSRHSSTERSEKIYGAALAPLGPPSNGIVTPHQQTVQAEINVDTGKSGFQSHSHHHPMQHQHHPQHPPRVQRVQYQEP